MEMKLLENKNMHYLWIENKSKCERSNKRLFAWVDILKKWITKKNILIDCLKMFSRQKSIKSFKKIAFPLIFFQN